MMCRAVSKTAKLNLFFDDRCNLCHRTMRFLAFVDRFNQIQPMPVSKSLPELSAAGISVEDATKDLYSFDPKTGRLCSGYDLYFYLSRRIALLYPLAPLLFGGYLLGIGPSVYQFVARRRRRVMGVCDIAESGEE